MQAIPPTQSNLNNPNSTISIQIQQWLHKDPQIANICVAHASDITQPQSPQIIRRNLRRKRLSKQITIQKAWFLTFLSKYLDKHIKLVVTRLKKAV